MDRNFGEPFQSFLNLAMGVARATWLLRRYSKTGQMLVHSTPRQFLESLTSELFILLSAKGAKTGVCRPDNLRLQGKVLRGLLVALSFIKSHI